MYTRIYIYTYISLYMYIHIYMYTHAFNLIDSITCSFRSIFNL